ncbi:DMT family transporter [Thiofaba sp. EF100]|jgi:drug/metabolite transporter (DMT)-like permease|uniref:DMT family transporter n=1 Tax=Thiofaba sp. EF100 TaxID=3121274 RepID=UPI0032219136
MTLPTSAPLIALLLAAILWGLSWIPLKHFAAYDVHGVSLNLVAYGGLALLFLPLLWRQRAAWRGQGLTLLGIALLGGYANFAFTTGMALGEVVRVMVLFYLVPVWGVLGGRLFLGEVIDRPRLLGVVLALTGALLILGGPAVLQGEVSWLDLLAISCGLAFAGNNIVFRARPQLPMGSKLAAMFLGCAAMAAAGLEAGVQDWPAAPAAIWGGVLLFGFGWVLLATLGTQWGVTHMEAGRAAILIILELVVAVVSAMLLGGERMSPLELAGGALILGAALLEGWREGKRPVAG